jgi:phosphoglucosamine mutase
MTEVERRLFGTDGVRGVANEDITAEMAFDLARAAGDGNTGTVAIGRDTRRSSPMLASAMAAGFNSVGMDVLDLAVIPVGGVSRLVRDRRAAYGVMVSASHNPAQDNGIKFFDPAGTKLSDQDEAAIETRFFEGGPWPQRSGAGVGTQRRMPDRVGRYVDLITESIEIPLSGIDFVVDTANGAAYRAAPELFARLDATARFVNTEPDGMNINRECGAMHPENLAAVAVGAVGLAFDGDADRLIAVDEDGEIVDGDVLMAIFAKWLHDRGELMNDTVVVTVMTNLGFRKAMEELDINVIETAVGDRYVLETMQATGAVIGGEQSGHIILEDRATGDGLRSVIRLMEVMGSTGKPLRELRTVMTEYPQVLTNVRVASKAFEDSEAVTAAIRAGENELAGRGRLLVRPSGTEPLIRVMVEAPTKPEAAEVAGAVAQVVEAELG